MAVDIHTLEDRPEFSRGCDDLVELWPVFMCQDPIADLYFAQPERHACHTLVAVDEDEVVGRAFAVPVALGEEFGRAELPPDGWDGVVRWAWLDELAGRPPTHLSALEINLALPYRGTGLADRLLAGLRRMAGDLGLSTLIAPVRPTRKHEEPWTPMAEYAAKTREDGLPADPWLRLHVRAGGRIHAVCPTSMTIPGTLEQWRVWTGRDLGGSSQVEVEGALVPVQVDQAQGTAVYVEPNVWVIHDL